MRFLIAANRDIELARIIARPRWRSAILSAERSALVMPQIEMARCLNVPTLARTARVVDCLVASLQTGSHMIFVNHYYMFQ